MYKIDTDKMTIEQIWEYGKDRGSKFYSPYISDVDYLEKDHYIVHSGGINYVDGKISNQPAGFSNDPVKVSDTVEILNDEVIYELVLPTNNYRVEKMSFYNEKEKLERKESKSVGTLGKTKINKRKIGTIKSIKPDKKYEDSNIKIFNEKDRLDITGKFKKSDDVDIILYKNLTSKYYHFDISTKPYTALCVDLLTPEQKKNGLNVEKFINYETLHGKYSVYIKINNKIYNTEKYIEVK